ncbi:tetratricopeptide repeat protein [Thermophagus xiamenensis]|uniref:Tetratricopeptide repeat-containing protein n=1 Tax=Thermophagus xiamenensis TaxID=385682 RepID=A0A1I1WHD5_9BACT|nr:tetratricopeptide repeat protein [Thermophagus xiamenensis]SFD94615.1 Tetratricopeptide repeat-containing protein [Thermophagus xiamenensis]
MKHLLSLSIVLFVCVGSIIAQEKTAAEFKNEGNDALRNKDYKSALELYEKALANWGDEEPVDDAMIYNMATCARRIENYDKAIKYYTMCEEKGFRGDIASYYIAYSYKKQDKEEDMEKVLVKAIDKYKTSKYLGHMKKMLVTYYLKKGAEPFNEASQILASAQNADPSQYDEIKKRANESFAKAKPWFEKVLKYDPNNSSAKESLKEVESRLNE